MKKLVIGVFGTALLFTIGTVGTLNASTVQSGTVPQSTVNQGTAQSADRLYLNQNNTCSYAGTFHNYNNCTGDCRNYVDEDQDGVCDNYEAGGYRAWKNQNTQSTQQDTEDTQNASSAQYTYGQHHGAGGQNGNGSGSGNGNGNGCHGGCKR